MLTLNRLVKAAAALALALTTNAVASESYIYDHSRLRTLAEDFINQQVTPPENGEVRVEAGGLDPRMAARSCMEPAQATLANNASLDRYSTVEISCTAGQLWRTFVPVRIYTLAPVVTATRALASGTLLQADDLSVKLMDTQMIRGGLYSDPEQLIGARVKKRIQANDAIIDRNTCLVCEGERVTIIAEQSGMRVSAAGIALNDGLFGESVAVRNNRSNKEVQATVAALNEVKVSW